MTEPTRREQTYNEMVQLCGMLRRLYLRENLPSSELVIQVSPRFLDHIRWSMPEEVARQQAWSHPRNEVQILGVIVREADER